jgi:hypothetical protein
MRRGLAARSQPPTSPSGKRHQVRSTFSNSSLATFAANIGRIVERIAEPELARQCDVAIEELVKDAPIHAGALVTGADLAVVLEPRSERMARGAVDVHVIPHDERRLASELK